MPIRTGTISDSATLHSSSTAYGSRAWKTLRHFPMGWGMKLLYKENRENQHLYEFKCSNSNVYNWPSSSFNQVTINSESFCVKLSLKILMLYALTFSSWMRPSPHWGSRTPGLQSVGTFWWHWLPPLSGRECICSAAPLLEYPVRCLWTNTGKQGKKKLWWTLPTAKVAQK